MIGRWCILAVLSVAVSAHAAPKERARAVVDRQLAALDDPAAFVATLASDAVILGNGSFSLASGSNAPAIVETLSASRSRLPVIRREVTRLDAGGNGAAVWFSADLFITRGVVGQGRKSGRASRVTAFARVSELLVADRGNWIVVALAFQSTSGVSAPSDALGSPGTGPLTAALASPRDVDDALSDDTATTVIGFCGELALGPDAAHKALARWREREGKLTGAIEIRTKTWGLAAGNLAIAGDSKARWRGPLDVNVLVFAIPDRRGWRLVVVDAVRSVAAQPDTFIEPNETTCP